MTIENWAARKWKEEIENLALEMWLGDKLARTVGILSIDTFDEDIRPAKLATAAATLEFIKYQSQVETGLLQKYRSGSLPSQMEEESN